MSLIDDLKTPKPWDLGTPANGVTMYNDTVKPLDDNIRMVASAVDNLPQPSEQVQANWNTSAASDPSFIQNKPTIPSKTSQLQNDAGFITDSAIPSVPTKTSDLDNDSGFITADNLPSKTSELTNDSGFITKYDVPRYQRHADWDEFSQGEASYIENNPFWARFMVPDYTVTSADISRGYCIFPVRIFPVNKMLPANELIWFINFENLDWQVANEGGGITSYSMKNVVEKIKIGYCTDSADWEGRYEPDGGPAPIGEIDSFETVTTKPCLKKLVNIVCAGSLQSTSIQGPSFKIMLKSGSDVKAGDQFGFDGYIRIIHWDGRHGLRTVLNN